LQDGAGLLESVDELAIGLQRSSFAPLEGAAIPPRCAWR